MLGSLILSCECWGTIGRAKSGSGVHKSAFGCEESSVNDGKCLGRELIGVHGEQGKEHVR